MTAAWDQAHGDPIDPTVDAGHHSPPVGPRPVEPRADTATSAVTSVAFGDSRGTRGAATHYPDVGCSPRFGTHAAALALNRQTFQGADHPAGARTHLRRGLSDDELAAVIRWIVRTWLEVQRGQRSPKSLTGLLAPHLLYGLRYDRREPGQPPVTAAGLGPIRMQRPGAHQAHAVVIVRDTASAWGAVVVGVRRRSSGAWLVTEMVKLS
jgi:hypothetical protein